MSDRDLLLVPMQDNDAGASTVGEYLQKLLEMVWTEEESFSGKRPFGNSGWQYELIYALVAAGKVEDSAIHGEGITNQAAAHRVVLRAIRAAFAP